MHLTLLQPNLYWHDPVANRAMLEERIFTLPEQTDLIVLPEMFTTGFTMNARAVAEPMNLTTFRWLKQMATQTGAVVTGSYVVREGDAFYNRLIWMQPDGEFDVYDKRHLFRMAGEDAVYTAGTRRIVKVWKGWRICPLICYDLRFPVWSRNSAQVARHSGLNQPAGPPEQAINKPAFNSSLSAPAHPSLAPDFGSEISGFAYDLLLYVANWPAPRRNAWNVLLRARAIENLSYVAGVNRVGEDGNQHAYTGDSAVIDFKGDVLFRQSDAEIVHQQKLSLDDLRAFRERFPANMDADEFTIC